MEEPIAFMRLLMSMYNRRVHKHCIFVSKYVAMYAVPVCVSSFFLVSSGADSKLLVALFYTSATFVKHNGGLAYSYFLDPSVHINKAGGGKQC